MTRLTKDEKNDLVNAVIKNSLRFNTEIDAVVVDGGFGEAYQGFFARYVNDKDKILKSVGLESSKVQPEDNIDNILIGAEIVSLIRREPELQRLGRHIQEGHVKIDVTTPATSLVYSDEITKHLGTNKALSTFYTEDFKGEQDFGVHVPSYGDFPDLKSGLKAAADCIYDAVIDVKRKAMVEEEAKEIATPNTKSKSKLKM